MKNLVVKIKVEDVGTQVILANLVLNYGRMREEYLSISSGQWKSVAIFGEDERLKAEALEKITKRRLRHGHVTDYAINIEEIDLS